MREWLYQTTVGIDQFFNALTGGSADETLSSRCYRMGAYRKSYRAAELFINGLFYLIEGWGHCKTSYIKDVQGRQLPHKFFDEAVRMNIEFDRDKLGVMVLK